MAKMSLDGIVTEVFKGEKRTYVTIVGNDGTFKFSSNTVELSDLPKMVPIHLELDLRGQLFGNQLALSIVELSASQMGSSQKG